MSTPCPSPTMSLLDFDDGETTYPGDEAELIIGKDVSLALLDDDDSVAEPGDVGGEAGCADSEMNCENHECNYLDDQPGAVESLEGVLEESAEDTNDEENVTKEVEGGSTDTVLHPAPSPIVITIESSDEEDDNTNPHDKSESESESVPPANESVPPTDESVKCGSSAVLGVARKANFKKPKVINSKLVAAASAFNAEIIHDFEISPCFHFNFNQQGCNREPNCIHGNYIKSRLHCCFDCFEAASAVAFHRRNDPRCPLRKSII